MKKLFTFLAGAALLGSLGACSSDEPTKGSDGPDKNPTGDAAYLAVRIMGDNASRATTDGGYEFGVADEHRVNNAKFFFFDDEGKYVLEAKIVNNPTTTEPSEGQDNVELNVTSVLVLDGLTEKGGRPTYMLTVINCPTFTVETGTTLPQLQKKLLNWTESKTEVTEADPDAKSLFVMSTSSYSDNKNPKKHDDKFYYATKIDPDLYKSSPEAAKKDENVVDVYVERLAAKISFGITLTDQSKKAEYTKDGRTHTIYALTQTVGGGPNEGEVDATTQLYIEVLDWNIGGLTDKSYVSKIIDTGWTFTDWVPSGDGIYWNDPTRFRSYWGQSTVYGEVPSSLSYANSKNLIGTNKACYCNENTNTPENIFLKDGSPTTAVNPEYVTHATIHAKICDKDGNAIPMVMANGVLHKQDEYIKKIISLYLLDGTKKINILVKNKEWTEGSTTHKEYIGVDYSYFGYVWEKKAGENKVGQAIFKFDDSKKSGTDKEYYIENPNPQPGKEYIRLEGEALNTEIANLNADLLDEQHTFVGADKYATIYDGGNFVYYVPIEHLGAKEKNTEASEGYYGVVRNHCYNLTIEEFAKVGHGIWDPDKYEETYKPDGQDEYYYLGARINILSWKIVNQSVKL